MLRRVLRSDSVISAAARVTALRSLTLAVNFVMGLTTAAFLGANGRGELATLILAPQVITGVATLGLPPSLIYNAKKRPESARLYIGCALFLALASGLAATLAGWRLLPLWLSRHDVNSITLAQVLLLSVPITSLNCLLSAVLQIHNRFGLVSSLLLFQNLATLLALAGLILLGELSPPYAAAAYVLPSIPATAYLAVQAWRLSQPRLAIMPPYSSHLLLGGLGYYGMDALSTIAVYLDQLLIVHLMQPAAVGVYAVALSLGRLLNLVQSAAANVLFPSVAGRSNAAVVELVVAAMRITTAMNASGALLIGLFAPQLLALFYGTEFAGAVTPLRILLIERVFYNAFYVLSQAYVAAGQPNTVTCFEGIGAGLSFALMVLLVPSLGVAGVALSVLGGALARFLCALVSLPFALHVRVPRFVLGRTDIEWVVRRWNAS